MQSIHIEEIPVEHIDEFWDMHMQYLLGDKIIDARKIRNISKVQNTGM